MRHITLKAPAKVNLSLDITGRREDGYHFLRSVMQAVTLFDTVSVAKTETELISISGDKPEIPCDERNIAYKAAVAFLEQNHLPVSGVHIDIRKAIPSEAGLGGGSADGAAVLAALNQLFDTRLDTKALREIGLAVGADIPFCIAGGTALAEGIGEILTPLPACPDCHIVICKPPVGVSTAAAYQKFDRAGAVCPPSTDSLIGAIEANSLTDTARYMKNVFEDLLSLPEVNDIEDLFRKQGALNAAMSGSGSAVFGIFESYADAIKAYLKCRSHYSDVFLCRPYSGGATILSGK